MKELTDWLRRQAELEQRNPCLEDAFVRHRFAPYALYRLRFFLARCLFNWGLHVAGVLLLFGAFSRREFGAIALAHLLAAFATSFWWGSLEEMRGHVRHLYRSGRSYVIPREVGRWLFLSLQIALLLLLGAVLCGALRLVFWKSPIGPADLYLLCIVFRVALEIPCRCYHSGIYAIRRVYRPLPAMLAVDIGGFLALIVLWPALGRWSFPVASFLSSFIVAGLAIYYTSRTYRLIGFQPLQHLRSRYGRRRFTAPAILELAAAGFASAVMSLDALLAIIIFVAGARHGTAASLFVVVFAVTPGIRAGYEWAQLFYFDLKRQEATPFGNLSAWLAKRVFRLGWVIGPVFWAAASLAAAAVLRKPILSLCLPLLPFFHSRALVAAVQVRTFADGAYAKLIGNGLVSLAAYLMVALLLKYPDALVGLAVVNYSVVIFLCRQDSGRRLSNRWREPVPPAVWFEEVGQLQSPIEILAVRYCPSDGEDSWRLYREQTQAKARALAGLIARKLGREGAVTVMHPGRILWFHRAHNPGALLQWAMIRGAGLLEVVGETGMLPGTAALREARSRGFFGGDVRHGLSTGPHSGQSRADLVFRELFPNGIVWAPGAPPSGIASLSPKETRNLLVDASIFVRDFYPNGRRSGVEVTALCAGYDLQSVFIAERNSNLGARVRWRSIIRSINLDAAMRVSGKADQADPVYVQEPR